MKKIAMLLSFAVVTSLNAAQEKSKKQSEFVIYTERNHKENHYIPSGWMGDYGDLKLNQGWTTKPAVGTSCIRIDYSGERKQGAGWTGIYWQSPANNWGDKRGGYDLSGYKSLTFMVRGEKGGEVIDKFMIGGIVGSTEMGDTDEASSDTIELTKEWQTITIPVQFLDMSNIIGGFGFAINADNNPNGAVFYIDEVKLN